MLSDRPYRRGRPYAVARAEIARESGKQFDPKVVEVFLSIPEETWENIRREASRDRSEQKRRATTENPALRAENQGADGPLNMAVQAR
jgi:HD-GYP domain-containing protein (c-di-GMP phosphodiesterase class II)